MERIRLITLLLSMLFFSISTSANIIASGTCGKNVAKSVKWELDDNGVLTISGEGPMKDFEESNVSWQKYRSSIKQVIIADGVTSIGSNAFQSCLNLSNITIGTSVKTIGGFAFAHNERLKRVTIPDNVVSIGKHLFQKCTKLQHVTFGNSVASIGDSTFMYSPELKSVTIGKSVTSIGKLAFEGCSELKEVVFPDVLQSIGERAFQNCLELKEVIFPDALQSIGKLAFSNCLKLYSLYIPNSVTFIGWDALPNVHITVGEDNPNYCAIQDVLYTKSLDTLFFCAKQREGTVEIPNTVRHIADFAFSGCKELKEVSIPNSVITIGREAFMECKSLHAIKIPDSVVSMGWNSLSGCTNLTKISIGKSLTSIGENYKKNITSCPKLTKISVSEDNPYFTVIDGILYTKEIDTLICCRKDIMEVTIPNTVKVIIWGAFEYCKNISSISIPEGVEQIPGYTFYGCKNLKSVYFPKSYVRIDSQAFLGCNNLKKIYLQSSDPNGDILFCVKTGQCTFYVPKGAGKIYEKWRDPSIHSNEPFKFDKVVEYDYK